MNGHIRRFWLAGAVVVAGALLYIQVSGAVWRVQAINVLLYGGLLALATYFAWGRSIRPDWRKVLLAMLVVLFPLLGLLEQETHGSGPMTLIFLPIAVLFTAGIVAGFLGAVWCLDWIVARVRIRRGSVL